MIIVIICLWLLLSYLQKIYVFLFVNSWKCNVKPIHLYNYKMFYLIPTFIVKLIFFKICQIRSITVKQIFSKYFVECKKCLKICYFSMVINVSIFTQNEICHKNILLTISHQKYFYSKKCLNMVNFVKYVKK